MEAYKGRVWSRIFRVSLHVLRKQGLWRSMRQGGSLCRSMEVYEGMGRFIRGIGSFMFEIAPICFHSVRRKSHICNKAIDTNGVTHSY